MILFRNLSAASKNFVLFINSICFLFTIHGAYAQNLSDSTKPFLASIEKNAGPRFTIRKSNAVFPEILKGNEEEMLPYIENFSAKNRDHLTRMYIKGKHFLPKAAVIFKKYKLPEELKILLALESGYDGNAVSSAGAVGYWQIMDEMASDYDMKYIARLSKTERKKIAGQKGKTGEKQPIKAATIKDDRKNFTIATHAAARYLRDCKRRLGDNWLLAVASYNCGVGNVRKAIKKSGLKNAGFWDIKSYLPAETRAYVMNFITLCVIFNNYEMFAKNKLTFADERIIAPEDLEKTITDIQPSYSDR